MKIKDLQELQGATDLQIVKCVDELVRVFAGFCEKGNREQVQGVRRQFFRNGMVIDSPTLFNGSFNSIKTPTRKTGRLLTFFGKKQTCNHNVVRPEELELIRAIFKRLVDFHHPNEDFQDNPRLDVQHYIQFLLENFIITHQFFTLMMLPIGKDKWVTIEKFIKSIECIHKQTLEKASFFYQEKNSEFKKNSAIQRMICRIYLVFFKLVENYCGGPLEENDLTFVLGMALKSKKKVKDYREMAKNTFSRLEKNCGEKKGLISFQEFFDVLLEREV